MNSLETVIDALEKRGFIDAISNDELRTRAKSPLSLYIGFDPTADSLHLGHLIGIVALTWFQKYGHSPVVVVGGGTGKIGDPSGKNVERPLIHEKLLRKNVQKIEDQLKKYLDLFHPKTHCQVVDNDDWLSSYSVIEFLRDIGKHFRLGPMLGKDSVRSRIDSEEGISFTEFSYQVLQGFDFYHLHREKGVCLQIGGSDQWGNITAGIELTRKLCGASVFGMTYPLLTRSDGQKFGKSEGEVIWLDPQKTSPYQLYQYLIRVSDDDVINLMRLLTLINMKEIIGYENAIRSKQFHPFEAQKRLAQEVTQFVHGKEGLELALRVTEGLMPGSKTPLDSKVLQEIARYVPHALLPSGEVIHKKYTDVLVKAGFVSSKGEVQRLIKNRGAYLNNQTVKSPTFVISSDHLIGGRYLLMGMGKKKKMLIETSI